MVKDTKAIGMEGEERGMSGKTGWGEGKEDGDDVIGGEGMGD